MGVPRGDVSLATVSLHHSAALSVQATFDSRKGCVVDGRDVARPITQHKIDLSRMDGTHGYFMQWTLILVR